MCSRKGSMLIIARAQDRLDIPNSIARILIMKSLMLISRNHLLERSIIVTTSYGAQLSNFLGQNMALHYETRI